MRTSYRKPRTGIAEAPCASLYPSINSTYPYTIVRADDTYSIHIEHDTAGKPLLFFIITKHLVRTWGYVHSNKPRHIRLNSCSMMSYVYQMTLCYQVTTNMATGKYHR